MVDQAGSEIYLRPAGDYVEVGADVAFATIVASARRRNEVAIGYRTVPRPGASAPDQGVTINPPKSARLTLGARDAVIVLAE